IAIGFPGNQFRGEILPELDKVRKDGLVRIVDLVFVTKDDTGDTSTIRVSDLTEAQRAEVGVVSDSLPDRRFESGSSTTLDIDTLLMITDIDVEHIVEDLPESSSVLIILFEHLWAVPLKEAFMNANGMLLGNWIIQPELLEADSEESEPVTVA